MTVEDRVLAKIDESREDLAALALRLGNTYAPWGSERLLADEVLAWYRENAVPAELQPITDVRANVVARLRGTGGGPSIVFNAHLDTEASGPEYDRLMAVPDPNLVGGRREGDRLFGHTILNDRGCMSLFMIAGRALLATPARSCAATSCSPRSRARPARRRSTSTRASPTRARASAPPISCATASAAIARSSPRRPTSASCWFNCGAAYYKMTLTGRNMYTPRLQRPAELADHPNAIVKAARVVEAVEAWAKEFEASRTGPTPCGEVRPKAQVGAIRGGMPWRPNRSSPYCALYVDVRTLPDEDVDAVTASLRAAVDATGPAAGST